MAYQETLVTDTLDAGRIKHNANFVELYSTTLVSVTGATSLTSAAFGKMHVLTGTSADYTVDMPTAVGNTGGTIAIKGANALTVYVTIQGVSGQTIDEYASIKIGSGGVLILVSDGTNWIILYEVGSWINYTPVYTGFSANPTSTLTQYFKQGKMCTVKVTSFASGTSNATTFTITLPFNASHITMGMCEVAIDNSAVHLGVIATRAASNIADIYDEVIFGAWVASGNKRASFTLTYRIA